MPLGFVEMRQAFGREGEYGRWLRQLPVAIKIDGLLFVHGGISPAVAPLGCDGDQRSGAARADERSRQDARQRAGQPHRSRRRTAVVPRPGSGAGHLRAAARPRSSSTLHVRAIVVAHTVAPLDRMTTRFDGRVIEIDTGMQPAYIADGRASALEIRGGEATAIYVDRRDPSGASEARRVRAAAGRRPAVISTIERKDRQDRKGGLMRKPSARTVHTIMRALAGAIDQHDLPAVEKIAEESQEDPFEVLISTMLSAQTRDPVTAAASARLFRVARTPRTMAKLTTMRIERLIYPVSFYRHKAKHVKETCRLLVDTLSRPRAGDDGGAADAAGRRDARPPTSCSSCPSRACGTSASIPTCIGFRTVWDGCGPARPRKRSRRCTRPPRIGGGRSSTSIS